MQPRYAAAAGTTHYSYQNANTRHQPGNSLQLTLNTQPTIQYQNASSLVESWYGLVSSCQPSAIHNSAGNSELHPPQTVLETQATAAHYTRDSKPNRTYDQFKQTNCTTQSLLSPFSPLSSHTLPYSNTFCKALCIACFNSFAATSAACQAIPLHTIHATTLSE